MKKSDTSVLKLKGISGVLDHTLTIVFAGVIGDIVGEETKGYIVGEEIKSSLVVRDVNNYSASASSIPS